MSTLKFPLLVIPLVGCFEEVTLRCSGEHFWFVFVTPRIRTSCLFLCLFYRNSNIEILQRFQNKTLRLITNAPWYVPNAVLHTDLQLLTIRAEITRMNGKYKAKLEAHPNDLAKTLCIPHTLRRISKITPLDLPQRF